MKAATGKPRDLSRKVLNNGLMVVASTTGDAVNGEGDDAIKLFVVCSNQTGNVEMHMVADDGSDSVDYPNDSVHVASYGPRPQDAVQAINDLMTRCGKTVGQLRVCENPNIQTDGPVT